MSSVRAAVLLTRGAEVALIRRQRAGAEYYLFPGGGVEPGESPAHAAGREAKEELGVDVRVGRVVATVLFQGRTQIFFVAVETAGRFGTGAGAELANDESCPDGAYAPSWVNFADLERLDVRPRAVARLVAASAGGWPLAPLNIIDGP
jgi:8-oxo-dGTP diphosphatase